MIQQFDSNYNTIWVIHIHWKLISGYAIVENRFLEITLSYEGINTWVAFGLSSSGSMPDTDVYYCQNRENIIGVESAFASGRCEFDTVLRL